MCPGRFSLGSRACAARLRTVASSTLSRRGCEVPDGVGRASRWNDVEPDDCPEGRPVSRQQAETDRIRELGVALEEVSCLVAYDITQRQLGWTPAPGSPLSNERSDATATPLGKTWGAGVEHPEEMVKLWFELGSQHLYTSGIQMEHDPMLIVPRGQACAARSSTSPHSHGSQLRRTRSRMPVDAAIVSASGAR